MSNYYRYIVKSSNLDRFSSVDSVEANTLGYGGIFQQDYPLTSSISIDFFPNQSDVLASQYGNPSRIRLKTLEPLFRRYSRYSDFYQFSSSYANFNTDNICLVSIPSIFYGDTISKGTVKLSIYSDGVLLSKIEDVYHNGELIQTTGSTVLESNFKNVAGVVLYDEGLIALFDNTAISSYQEKFYSKDFAVTNPDYVRWTNWGISKNLIKDSVISSSYDIEFDGINKIPQLTLLAHAPKGELNNSTNYTFVKREQDVGTTIFTGSKSYQEPADLELKNITKNLYLSPTASFHKETYISKILIYDEEKNVIGVAKLAKPVRKTESRDFTFKLKLDL